MRKQPKQARSRHMVAMILEAAADVLHEDGITHFGTRQVAERAGISVGSLYQYFDHKEAILEALGHHLTGLVKTRLQAVLPSLVNSSPREFIRILIGSAYEVLDQDDGRYLHLLQHWQMLDISDDVRHLERLIRQSLELLSASHPALRRLPDLQRTLYIALNSVLFNLMRYTSEPSPYFSREELVEGLVDMVELYFLRQVSASG